MENKNIGEVVRKYRTLRGLTQEELGAQLFVSKQAVSKWENGRTLPDIETVRRLCEILEINRDEILGGSIAQTKKSRKLLRFCIIISVCIAVLSLFFAVFYVLDISGYIERQTQSGVMYFSVFVDGDIITTDEYKITSDLESIDMKNAYKFDIDYGEVRGTTRLSDKYDIEFGFINVNNWHNVNIRLDVEILDNEISVKQTVTYKTDNDLYEVLITEADGDRAVSVFKPGA